MFVSCYIFIYKQISYPVFGLFLASPSSLSLNAGEKEWLKVIQITGSYLYTNNNNKNRNIQAKGFKINLFRCKTPKQGESRASKGKQD